MFENENVDAWQVTVAAVFGVLLIVLAMIGLQVLFYRMDKADQALGRGKEPAELAAMKSDQKTQISGYHWADPKAGVAQIPIERAMKLVVDDLQAQRH